jgi:hypothetical protein
MKDIKTELDNTLEILSSKVLNVQEWAFSQNWRFKCIYCGLEIHPSDFIDFEDFKRVTEAHTHECVLEDWKKRGIDISNFSHNI